MDLTEDIGPVTALTRGAADLINRATERHRPIVITQNSRPTAVLQDVASYEHPRRVLHLLKLPSHDVTGEHGPVGPAASTSGRRARRDVSGVAVADRRSVLGVLQLGAQQ